MKKNIQKLHSLLRECNLSESEKLFFIMAVFLVYNEKGNVPYDLYDSLENLLHGYHYCDMKHWSFIKDHPILNGGDFISVFASKFNEMFLDKNEDILNLFYEEMMKYQNNDSKTLGIVMTPNDIVKLMVSMVQLNENDIFLDLCCGTGSFICEALKYNVKKVVGCELQDRLYHMTLCNMILRSKLSVSEIIKGDCFGTEFKATKSVINPPFSMKNKTYKELNFVKKQIRSVHENGLIASIFPVSCLNSSEKQLKMDITECCTIKVIVILNNKVFYPSASVGCCILLIQKGKPHDFENDIVKIINFENDGFVIEKQIGRVKVDDYKLLYDSIQLELKGESQNIHKVVNVKLNIHDDWNFTFYSNTKKLICYNDLQDKFTDLMVTKILHDKQKRDDTIDFIQKNTFFITELFDIKKGKNVIKNSVSGNVPLVSSCSTGNGITKYVKESKFSSCCLTLSKNGNVGDCFFQPYPFDATADVYILEPKDDKIRGERIGVFFASAIQSSIKGKYNWGYKLNDVRLSNETIVLPVIRGSCKIDFSAIEKIMEIFFIR